MSERRRSFAGRDQQASAFGATLMRLCDAVAAVGAALVDAEGETVDYAGAMDPFEIKIAAAELCILLAELRHSRVLSWKDTVEIQLRGSRKSFYARVLSEGYAVVMQLPHGAFNVSRRAIAEAARELSEEAGLKLPADIALAAESWWRVDVRCTGAAQDPHRPNAVWVDGGWRALEVIGLYVQERSPREFGYRARLDTGAEITLIRERLGRWYVDARPGK